MQVLVIIMLIMSLVISSSTAPVGSSDTISIQQSEVLSDLFEYTNILKTQGLIKETPEQKGKFFFD